MWSIELKKEQQNLSSETEKLKELLNEIFKLVDEVSITQFGKDTFKMVAKGKIKELYCVITSDSNWRIGDAIINNEVFLQIKRVYTQDNLFLLKVDEEITKHNDNISGFFENSKKILREFELYLNQCETSIYKNLEADINAMVLKLANRQLELNQQVNKLKETIENIKKEQTKG